MTTDISFTKTIKNAYLYITHKAYCIFKFMTIIYIVEKLKYS